MLLYRKGEKKLIDNIFVKKEEGTMLTNHQILPVREKHTHESGANMTSTSHSVHAYMINDSWKWWTKDTLTTHMVYVQNKWTLGAHSLREHTMCIKVKKKKHIDFDNIGLFGKKKNLGDFYSRSQHPPSVNPFDLEGIGLTNIKHRVQTVLTL